MDKEQKSFVAKAAFGLFVVLALVFGFMAYSQAKANDKLEAQYDDLNSKFEAAVSAINDLKEKVSDLELVNEKLGEEKAAADVKIKDLEKELADIKNENEALGDELDAIKEEAKAPPGYIIDEIALGDNLERVIDDSDLPSLVDASFELDDKTYDYKQEILFSSELVLAANGLGYDKDFGSEAYLVCDDQGALNFRVTFDDVVDINDVSRDDPLEFDFLGREISVVSIDNSEMELRSGEKYALNEGEEVVVDGVKIVLNDVGENQALFYVDGELIAIEEGDTEKINGVEIYVDEVIEVHTQNYNKDVAYFYAGENIYDTVDNGDELVENPNWYLYWQINGNDELEFVEIWYNEESNKVDDTYPALKAGEKFDFPWGMYSVVYDGLTEVDYAKVELSFDEKGAEDDLGVDTNMMVLKASEKLFVVDNEEVDKLYIYRSNGNPAVWQVYYYNDDRDLTLATSSVNIEYDDFDMSLVLQTGGDKNVVIGDVSVDVRPLELKIGNVAEEKEATDILVNNVNFGTFENKVLTPLGIKLDSVEDMLEEDEVVLYLPSGDVEGQVRVVYNG